MAGRGRISENVIFQEGLAEFYRNTISDKTVFDPELIRVDTGDFRFNISNNLVVEQESFRKNWAEEDDDKGITYICTIGFSNVTNITSCKFMGLTKGIHANRIRMQDCEFENCTNIVRGLQEESSISNCRFLSCYGSLIESNFGFLNGSLLINSCQFTNVNNASVDKYTKRFHPASITFGRVNAKHHNVMENCNFYGAVLGDQYLIACRDTTEINELMTEIEGCTFRNCITSRSDGVIINTRDASVSGQKKSSKAQVIKVKNCVFINDSEEDARVV